MVSTSWASYLHHCRRGHRISCLQPRMAPEPWHRVWHHPNRRSVEAWQDWTTQRIDAHLGRKTHRPKWRDPSWPAKQRFGGCSPQHEQLHLQSWEISMPSRFWKDASTSWWSAFRQQGTCNFSNATWRTTCPTPWTAESWSHYCSGPIFSFSSCSPCTLAQNQKPERPKWIRTWTSNCVLETEC